jgi:AcrR family transcriptional regulator
MRERRDPATRRRELIQAAYEVFVDRGSEGTRISDIARRAGVASSLVTYYFPNRDDLHLEVTRYAIDRFFMDRAAALARIEDPLERLEFAITRALPTGASDGDWTILLQFWNRAVYRPTLQTVATMFQARARAMYVSVIESGVAVGRFAPVAASEDIASTLIAAIEGLAIRILLNDPDIHVAKMESLLHGYVRLAVGAPSGSMDR